MPYVLHPPTFRPGSFFRIQELTSHFLIQPERISGHPYSIRSDVWSTGLSLLELVQNRFPFPNDLPAIELMMYISASEVIICSSRTSPFLTWLTGIWNIHILSIMSHTLLSNVIVCYTHPASETGRRGEGAVE